MYMSGMFCLIQTLQQFQDKFQAPSTWVVSMQHTLMSFGQISKLLCYLGMILIANFECALFIKTFKISIWSLQIRHTYIFCYI